MSQSSNWSSEPVVSKEIANKTVIFVYMYGRVDGAKGITITWVVILTNKSPSLSFSYQNYLYQKKNNNSNQQHKLISSRDTFSP